MPPKAKTSKKVKGRKVPKARNAITKMAGLDAAAAAHARLLADPCNAPLARPVYGFGAAGVVTRFETSYEVTFSSGYPDYSAYFCPGILSSVNCGGVGQITGAVATSGSATTTSFSRTLGSGFPGGVAIQPGYSFLNGLGGARARPVAACIRITYLGTELNRSGMIGTGQYTLNEAVGAIGTVAGVHMQDCDIRMRIPDGTIERRWTPNPAADKWCQVGDTTDPNANSYGDCGTLTFALMGMSPGTSVRVSMITVLEWTPGIASGVSPQTSTGPSASRNSVADVLHFLERAGNWTHTVAGSAANTAVALYNGGRSALTLARGVRAMALTL